MYVRPHLECASPAWATITATKTGLLESLKHRAMLNILTLPRTHHITDADYAALNITCTPLLSKNEDTIIYYYVAQILGRGFISDYWALDRPVSWCWGSLASPCLK
ncbi:hypothetical protein CAPTEDRAFT_209676 [Capitella teleta]|uniref:Uncharacterized protein n=1 Tax=Capitella teleta TaxID=283909 RepID=R7UVY9_CAPTE|nr:hypothetical protein CAPTEDRAFT_209676 [Capitella teleta]|eukprot:ELU10432.1 hypothetical protein CAPTEDRAFT_209676 [Capitella teleta]